MGAGLVDTKRVLINNGKIKSSPMSNGQLTSDVTALESVTRLIEHDMIFITSDFGDCDLAQS